MRYLSILVVYSIFLGLSTGEVEEKVLGLVRETGWPKCLSGMEYPEELNSTLHFCDRRVLVEMRRRLGSYLQENPTFSMIEGMKAVMDPLYSRCIVQRMGYDKEIGSLDNEKILKDFDRIRTKSPLKLFRLRSIVTLCLKNATGENADQDFASLLNCIRSRGNDFCNDQKKTLEVYLNSDVQPSRCTSVKITPEMEEFVKTCIDEESETPKDDPRRRRRNTPGKNNTMPIGARVSLCLAKKLSYYTPFTGFSFSKLNEVITNLVGFHELKEDLRINLTSALNDCSDLVGGSTTSFTVWYQWEICIRPKIVDLCGFGNNVTNILFPLLGKEVKGVAWKYVINAVSISLDQKNDGN